MTRRAARQIRCRTNLALVCELRAHFRLVRRRLPFHVVYLIERPQHRFRIAVAIDAPAHIQRGCLENQRHLIDSAVACGTAYAFRHVDAVIEIYIFGQPMDAHPMNRLVSAVAFPHRLEISDIIEEHRVAIHAGLRRRHTGDRRTLDARVAIAAVDAIIADVMLVAELNGLIASHPLIGDVGRSSNDQHRRENKTGEDRGSKQTKPRNKICTAMKDLGHVSVALARISSPEGYPRENYPYLCRTVRVRVGDSTA
jgi:predicted nuclease with RNAse H fold